MNKLQSLALVAGSLAASVASAAVPAGAEAIFTTAATDFGVLLGYGFTAMTVVIGGWIVFRQVKKMATKSTS
jgi:hypothetical protein